MSSWIHALQAAVDTVTAGNLVLFLLRATLVAALGKLALTLAFRASSASRHIIATATLAALVMLPVATSLLPSWRLAILPRNPSLQSPGPALRLGNPDTFKRSYDSVDGDTPYVAEAPTPTRVAATPATIRGWHIPALPRMPRIPMPPMSWPLVVTLVLAAGAELLVLRCLISLAAAAWFVRTADDLDDPRLLSIYTAARERLGVTRRVHVKVSSRVSLPVVSGVLEPTLLLPAEALSWPQERLNVVFLHELAHVHRGDILSFLMSRIAGASYWFHPIVRHLVRDARRECEQACDDLVLRSGVRASEYAEHLLRIASAAKSRDALGGAVLAIARPSNLELRLSSILESGVDRAPASRRSIVLAAIVGVALVAPLATVRVTAAPAPHPVRAAAMRLDALSSATPVVPVTAPAVAKSELASVETPASESTAPASDCTSTPEPAEPVEPAMLTELPDPAVAMGIVNAVAGGSEFDGDELQFHDVNPDPKATDERTGSEWWSKASRNYNRERYADAALAYENAAKAGYRMAVSYYNAACSYSLARQLQPALKALHASVQAGWDDYDKIVSDDDLDAIRNTKGYHAILDEVRAADPDESDRKEANAEYEVLKSRGSKDADAWGDAGISLMRAGDTSKAVTAFENQIRLEPGPNAIYNLACAHSLNGNKTEALAALERSIWAGFSSARHMTQDDDLEGIQREHRFDDLVDLTRDLELNPDGLHDGDRSGWQDELPRFQRVAQKYPNGGRAWFNLGYAQLRVRDGEGSTKSFTKALELKYRSSVTMYNLACCAAQKKDVDGTLKWLDSADKAGMDIANYVQWDRDLDPVRSDSRFRALAHKLQDRQIDKVRSKMKWGNDKSAKMMDKADAKVVDKSDM